MDYPGSQRSHSGTVSTTDGAFNGLVSSSSLSLQSPLSSSSKPAVSSCHSNNGDIMVNGDLNDSGHVTIAGHTTSLSSSRKMPQQQASVLNASDQATVIAELQQV